MNSTAITMDIQVSLWYMPYLSDAHQKIAPSNENKMLVFNYFQFHPDHNLVKTCLAIVLSSKY